MINVTIATHNGTKVSQEHNRRNRKVTDKEDHINPNGIYEIWHDENIRQAYNDVFGEAVKEYNSNQTRADRRIKNYYSEIKKDAKRNVCYEMIVGVYEEVKDDIHLLSDDTKKEILQRFMSDWQERNPNLHLVGAYYHADEQGEPHVHIDYFPVAHGYQRGMSVQNGLVKALSEMGFEKDGKETAQIQWERRENNLLESICKEYNLEVVHPIVEERRHLETNAYKAQEKLSTTIDSINLLGDKENVLKTEIEALTQEHTHQSDLKKQITGTDIFGRTKNNVTLSYEEYQKLCTVAHRVQDVEKTQEDINKALKEAEALKETCMIKNNNIQHVLDDNRTLREAIKREKAILDNAKALEDEYIYTQAQDFVDKALGNRYTKCEDLALVYLKTLNVNGVNGVIAFNTYKQEIEQRERAEASKLLEEMRSRQEKERSRRSRYFDDDMEL